MAKNLKAIKMKRIIILSYILLLSQLCVFAQSVKSDTLFAKGVEMYDLGNFVEAIPYFEESNALDMVEIDTLSCRRGYSAGWLASCYYKLGDIDNAIKYDRYQYRFKPVDRRYTIVADSIQDSLFPDLMNNQFSSALPKLKLLSKVEHELYDRDHYAHLQTYRWLGLCHLNMQHINDALSCIEEAYRLARLNYGENDTIQIQDIYYLINIYSNTMRFDKASQCIEKLNTVINENYDKNHPANVDIQYWRIAICLMQRKWYDASTILPDFISAVQRCFSEKEQMLNALNAMHTMYFNCGRSEECISIEEAILNVNQEEKPTEDSFPLLSLKLTNTINQKKFEEAERIIQDLEVLDGKLPDDQHFKRQATIEFFKCYIYMMTNRIDEAKDIFLGLENSLSSELIESDLVLNPLYLSLKTTICVLLSDYEGALDAVDKLVLHADSTYTQQNLNLHAFQACFSAMSGMYERAKKLTARTVNSYKAEVIDKNALYRIEKDTTELNGVIRLLDGYIKGADNMPDSVSYTLREIKGEYLLVKADLLKKLKNYQIDYDYYDCISDYVLELLRIRKYPEAQTVMNDYINEWNDVFSKIDPNSENENDQWDRIMALFAIEEALYFRCQCYEKRDPEGVEAYNDLLKFVKYNSSDDINSEYYRKAKIQYYQYLDDSKGLLEYMREIAYVDKDNISAKSLQTLAECLEGNGEYSEANLYWKRLIGKLMSDSSAIVKNEKVIYSSLERIIINQTHNLCDTLPALEYVKSEFFPALDRSENERFRLFIKTIYNLAYHIDDDSFIPYIENEKERLSKLILSPYHTAFIYQAIAGVLSCGEYKKELAIEYIIKARELVKDDEVLNVLFGCYLHKILDKCGIQYDEELIKFGNTILEIIHQNGSLAESTEYAELAHRQMESLIRCHRYSEAKTLGLEYFNHRSTIDVSHLPHIFNGSHSLYEKNKFLNENPLHDYSILTDRFIREKLYTALTCSTDPDASTFALKVIEDEYDGLYTTMNVNRVYTNECDDLISLTSKMAYHHKTDSLRGYAYNSALFCKGLQLQSSNAIRAIIKKSGHKGALRKFDELQMVMHKLTYIDDNGRDSLLSKRYELEKDLSRLSSYFGDYKKDIRVSWQDVQKSLQDDELAIEFTFASEKYMDDVRYKYGYYACILRKDMSIPDIIFICEKDSLSSDIEIYKNPALSNKLLAAFEPYLHGIRNIYYSPIGEFNQISIESLPINDISTKTIASKYNMYRVSSTREVIGNKFNIEGDNAIVYGGLKYDATLEEMVADAKKYSRKISIVDDEDSNINPEILRGLVKKIPYLEGTKIEAENVIKIINSSSNNLIVDAFMGIYGTESSFKSLNGKQKKIIHIATHGFYFDEKAVIRLTQSSNSPNIKGEDRSLMRSGLFFAGATNRYRGQVIPTGLDDGILTSHEIANMDLSGLDLCVLSACQTAQGDISSEGVFGLQRGFKKAGANSILMSLWPVDDEATCFLMTEFYHYWIHKRKTKYEALELAKQKVRSQSKKGWDNPKFWAAFILLDAVDKVFN